MNDGMNRDLHSKTYPWKHLQNQPHIYHLAHTKLDLLMFAQLEAHNPDMNLINREKCLEQLKHKTKMSHEEC